MARKTTAASSHPATNTATIHDVKLKRGAGGELHQTAEGDTPVLTTELAREICTAGISGVSA